MIKFAQAIPFRIQMTFMKSQKALVKVVFFSGQIQFYEPVCLLLCFFSTDTPPWCVWSLWCASNLSLLWKLYVLARSWYLHLVGSIETDPPVDWDRYGKLLFHNIVPFKANVRCVNPQYFQQATMHRSPVGVPLVFQISGKMFSHPLPGCRWSLVSVRGVKDGKLGAEKIQKMV